MIKYYKVRFLLLIHGCFASGSSLDKYAYRDIELPFVPNREICFKLTDEIYIEEISEIIYDVKEQSFKVYCGEDREIYDAELHKEQHRTIEEICEDYKKLGWQIK